MLCGYGERRKELDDLVDKKAELDARSGGEVDQAGRGEFIDRLRVRDEDVELKCERGVEKNEKDGTADAGVLEGKCAKSRKVGSAQGERLGVAAAYSQVTEGEFDQVEAAGGAKEVGATIDDEGVEICREGVSAALELSGLEEDVLSILLTQSRPNAGQSRTRRSTTRGQARKIASRTTAAPSG